LPTETTLVSSVNPSAVGQPVTFTATVAPAQGAATPSGSVTFLEGPAALGTGDLDASGHATFATATLPLGDHPVAARYNGDTHFAVSTSPALTQRVSPGPFVVSTTPADGDSVDPPLTSVRVTFNIAIDPNTFTAAAVTLTDPTGMLIQPVTVAALGATNTQFEISFPPQNQLGTYHLALGTQIKDAAGNPLPSPFAESINVAWLFIEGNSDPVGTCAAGYASFSFYVTFNEPVKSHSFHTSQISITPAPASGSISVVPVPVGKSAKKFLIRFTPVVFGSTTIVLGPNIKDVTNHPMDQDKDGILGQTGCAPAGDQYCFMADLTDPCLPGMDEFGHKAGMAPFQDLSLQPGQPGVFEVLRSGHDLTAPVDLGSNSFTFYGARYTGAQQLYVSSNGLITFGSGYPASANTDLSTAPPQPAIAVLWGDWWKPNGPGTAPDPMVLGKFDGNRLILEWHGVFAYASDRTNPATFQAILQLNTGAQEGDIVCNYPDLDVGDPALDNGGGATVGIKDQGTRVPDHLLVSYNDSTHPYVRSGQALHFFVPAPLPLLTAGPTGALFAASGTGWTTHAGGHGGAYLSHPSQAQSDYAQATWRLPVSPGTYAVYVTWVESTGNATDAHYRVYDGSTLLGSFLVDQSVAPTTVAADGTRWQLLGTFTTSTRRLRVVLDNGGNGTVVADAVFLAFPN
jgi:hypothetical protein